MDDTQVIAAILDSREAYDALVGRLAREDFSEYGQLVLREAMAYYKADKSVHAVDRDLVVDTLARAFPDREQSRAVVDYLTTVPQSRSPGNAVRLYKSLRRYNIGLCLADYFAQGQHTATTQTLIEKYRELEHEDNTDWKPLLSYEDVFGSDRKEKIRFYPKRVNTILGGGMRAGETMLIFGRPGSGKTAVAINSVSGSLRDGHSVLYVGNEESQETLQRRFLSRLGGETLSTLNSDGQRGRNAWRNATQIAEQRGLQNLHIVHGDLALPDLESYVRRVSPDILVIDQMQHIDGGSDNRTRTMENTMRELRNWAHEYQLVAIPIAQAGDSGEWKACLQMSDVDYSNTGVQGACDVMLGVGMDMPMKQQGKRILSFCRNKVSGNEGLIPVWIDKQHTAIRNRPVGGNDE